MTSKDMTIQKNPCFSNVPMLIKLAPYESITNYLTVQLLKPYDEIKDENFKLVSIL
jgi:hypothetical protein